MSIGILCVGFAIASMIPLSYEKVFWYIRFQLAIRSLSECQNGIDDDDDGYTDYPDDDDCTDGVDDTEVTQNPPTVVCFATSTQWTIGQSMTWIAIPSNGNGTYTYSWSGTGDLSGTTGAVNIVYTVAGAKNAIVRVTSGGVTSSETPCVTSITITSWASSGGGGGGGGGGSSSSWASSSTATTRPPITTYSPSTDSDSGIPLNAAPDKNTPVSAGSDVENHPVCEIPTPQSTFKAYKDYLVCDNLITERIAEEEYEYEKFTPRKELLWVAVEIALKDKNLAIRQWLDQLTSAAKTHVTDVALQRPFHFFDIGLDWQPAWIAETVHKGVILWLVSTDNTLFRPEDHSTRAEAFAMMMKAVCMNPDASQYPTWEERVYDTARKNNITIRTWKDFEAHKTILRQELFVLAGKLDVWKDVTWGCTPLKQKKPIPAILMPKIILDTTTPSLPSAPVIAAPSEQVPWTFAFLYENSTEKTYSYIVKSGGLPDGVRAQYIRIFWGTRKTAQKLTIHDIAGTEYPENRWLLGWELVYITFQK